MSPQPDNDLRGKFQADWAQFEAEPAQDLWPGIEAELAPPARRSLAWYWVAAAALALLFLGWGWARWSTAPAPAGIVQQVETGLPSTSPMPAPSSTENKALPPQPELDKPTPAPKPRSPRPEPQPAKSLAQVQPPANPDQTVAVGPLSPPDPKVAVPKPTQSLPTVAQAAEPERASTPAAPRQKGKPLPETRKQRIDLNQFSLEEALATASETLNKRIGEPVRIEKETETRREVRTVEVGFLNLKITHKRYRDESL